MCATIRAENLQQTARAPLDATEPWKIIGQCFAFHGPQTVLTYTYFFTMESYHDNKAKKNLQTNRLSRYRHDVNHLPLQHLLEARFSDPCPASKEGFDTSPAHVRYISSLELNQNQNQNRGIVHGQFEQLIGWMRWAVARIGITCTSSSRRDFRLCLAPEAWRCTVL